MKKSIFVVALLVIGAISYAMYRTGMIFPNFESMTPQQAYQWIRHHPDGVVLDVRTPSEYSSGHLKGARLVPVQELSEKLPQLTSLKSKPLLVYCRSGHRSAAASKILADHGFKPLNMKGGIVRWIAEGLPVVR